MNTCLDWKSKELVELAKQVGVESTPAFADKVGSMMSSADSSALATQEQVAIEPEEIDPHPVKITRSNKKSKISITIPSTEKSVEVDGYTVTSEEYPGVNMVLTKNIVTPNGLSEETSYEWRLQDVNTGGLYPTDGFGETIKSLLEFAQYDIVARASKSKQSLEVIRSIGFFVKPADTISSDSSTNISPEEMALPSADQVKVYMEANKPNENIEVDGSNVKVRPQGLSHAEVMLPAWTKKFFTKEFSDENGDVDFRRINSLLPEVMDMIGYRIPTEDKYSILPLRVVGFLPSHSGGGIMLPAEITTISGSDFDVDKMYAMFKHIVLNKQGKLEVEKYLDESNSTVKDRKIPYLIRTDKKALEIKNRYKDIVSEINERISRSMAVHNGQLNSLIKKKELQDAEIKELIQSKNDLIDQVDALREQWSEVAIELETAINPRPEDVVIYKMLGVDITTKEYRDSIQKENDLIKSQVLEMEATIDDVSAKISSMSKDKVRKADIESKSDRRVSKLKELLTEKRSAYEKRDDEINQLMSDDDFNNIPILDQNTKRARDNKLIDVSLSVMRNPSTAEAIFNPGGYANLKDNIAREIKSRRGIGMEKASIFDADVVDRFTVQNTAGRDLKGIAASHNSFRALLQHSDIRLAEGPVLFDGKEYYDLSGNDMNQKSSDGRSITRAVSEILASSVDNGKDPLLADINYSENTANMIFMLLSLGVDPMTVFAFMNQPSMLKASEMVQMGEASSIEGALKALYKSITGNQYSKKGKSASMLKKDSLLDSINKVGSEFDNSSSHLSVIVSALVYSQYSNDFNKIILASKADTAGIGKFIEEGNTLLRNIEEARGVESISGIEDFLSGTGANKIVSSFTEFGVEKVIDNIFSKLYPYSNRSFSIVKERIEGKLPYKLSAEEAQMINRHLIQYLTSGFGFYSNPDGKTKQEIVLGMPSAFKAIKKAYPDFLANNDLFNKLVVDNDETMGIGILKFDNNMTATEEQKEGISRSWKELNNPEAETLLIDYIESNRSKLPAEKIDKLSSDPNDHSNLSMIGGMINDSFIKDNEELSSLVRDYLLHRFSMNLIRYSFYTTGHMFTPKSMSSLIPLPVYLGIESYGVTMSKMVQSIMNKDMSEYGIDNFIDKFYRNEHKNYKFVPAARVAEGDVDGNVSSISNTEIRIDPYNITNDSLFSLSEGDIVVENDFISHSSKLESGEVEVRLYKFDRIENSEIIYKRTYKLGVPNQIYEYDAGASGFKSIIPENNYTVEDMYAEKQDEFCN
jgi:hypothetical protein